MKNEPSRFQRTVQNRLYMRGADALNWKVDDKKPHEVRRQGVRSYAKDIGGTILGTGIGAGIVVGALHAAESTPSARYQYNLQKQSDNQPTQAQIIEGVQQNIADLAAKGDNPNLQLKASRDQHGKMILHPNPNSDPNEAQPPVATNETTVK